MEKNISPLLRKGTTLNLIEVAFIRIVAVELDEIMIGINKCDQVLYLLVVIGRSNTRIRTIRFNYGKVIHDFQHRDI